MPICKRDGFDSGASKNKDQRFHDNEDVFFCEVTKEIFREYDDYFKHVMVINSTVWQCEETGRDNLTYAEALKSERRARKKMEMFKDSLRPPVILVIEQAKQSSVNALHSIVFKFVRRRFFINEEVQAPASNSKYMPYKVISVIPPGKTVSADNVYEETDKLQYKLRAVANGVTPAEMIVPFENIRRQRSEFTSDNLHMFIKSNVTRVEGILCPKPESLQKYVTDRQITFSSIFIGKMPYFTPAKIKKPNSADAKKTQATINKYLNKQGESKLEKTDKKYSAAELAKREAARVEKANTLKEEMERVRREKQERLVEAERQKHELRVQLMYKVEEECNVLLAKTDDLERNDQRLLPKFTPIQTLLPTKLLGDAFMLREFLHTFVSVLSGLEALRGNLSFYEMSRAFTQREVAGPLSDIVRILLGTIFDLQKEEEEDYCVEYLVLRGELRNIEPIKTMSAASRSHIFAKRHYSVKINELPLDALTVSEVLRLHLLGSGAFVSDRVEKSRTTYRNGYTSSEDPGLALRMQHPHLLRALNMYTLYQLPFIDIMRILRCLMEQILSYASIIHTIDDRMEAAAKARIELRSIVQLENKRLSSVQTQKRIIDNEYNQEYANETVRGDEEKKRNLETKHNKDVADLLAAAERDKRKYDEQLKQLYGEIFNFLVFLGMDRAYRKYYVLESMPGIFIEHPTECYDVCLDNPPTNLPPDTLESNASLPKNRKELRTFLFKKYSDVAKQPKTNTQLNNNNNTNNNLNNNKSLTGENKENQQLSERPMRPNGISNGHDGDVLKTNDVTALAETEVKLPTQYELYMCTGDRHNCIVHDERNPDRQRWAYIYRQEDIDALIEALNPLGERELQLREKLSSLRVLILQHVKKCPVDMLSLENKVDIRRFKNNVEMDTHRRYHNANFGFDKNADINEVMHAALVQRILQFEHDIYRGDLGRLKVKDMAKWRKDLQQNTYDAQVTLQWGPHLKKKATSGTEMDIDEVVEDEDVEEIKEKSGGTWASTPYFDPGQYLGDTLEIDSEDSADEEISLHDSPTIRSNVKQLASALLQVQQAIERRFLQEPFRPPLKQNMEKDALERKIKIGSNRLKQWELSLMKCTSYSQVFVHLNILHDSIAWARSTAKSYCQVCRRGSDPNKMLLCDECNGGTHMFCMKPKMKTVPQGNWYCKRCVQLLGVQNEAKTKATTKIRRRQLEVKAEEEDIADSRSDISATSSNTRATRSSRSKRLRNNEIEDLLKDEEEDDEDNEEQEADGSEMDEDNDDDEEKQDDEEEEDNDAEAVEEEYNEQSTAESEAEEEEEENEDEQVCTKCSYDGGDLMCVVCKDIFHLECANLKRPPRYNFVCAQCKAKEEKKRKLKSNDSTEEDDTDATEKSDPPNKRSRQSRASLRNSLTNGTHNGTVKNRRSHRRTGEDLPLNSPALYELLEDVMKHEQAWPFLRPVMQSEVPDYYQIIKHPMDFAKVKSKLNMGKYQLNEEVMNDIQMVFNNCDQYNVKGNEIYEAGATLEKFVMSRCKKLNLPFLPSDMNA